MLVNWHLFYVQTNIFLCNTIINGMLIIDVKHYSVYCLDNLPPKKFHLSTYRVYSFTTILYDFIIELLIYIIIF